MISFKSKQNLLVCFISLLFFILSSQCVSRLQIKTISALDTPIPQIEHILLKFLHNHRELWTPTILNRDEWCLYIRFLYDNILRRQRFSYAHRYNQIFDFINSKKSKINEDFLNFGVFLLDGIQTMSNNAIIYEPLFQKFVYPFIQDQEERDKIELIKNIVLLLEPIYNLSEFSAENQEKRTECGPCLDMYEMLHFMFLMGYSNIGLKYFRDNDLEPGKRTGNTTLMVQNILENLFKNEKSQSVFLDSMDFFLLVLGNGLNMKSDEMYQNINFFAGEDEQEKKQNRQKALMYLFLYYSQMQEQLVITFQLQGNPDLEQFFIKGGIMLCTYGIKEYLIGDIAVTVSSNEVVNEVASMVATQAAGKGVSNCIEAINIPEIVATKNQKVQGSSKGNILENLIGGIAKEVLPSIYIEIDNAFLKGIQENKDIFPVSFSRRRLLL